MVTKNMLASEICRFNVYTCIDVCMQQLKPVEGIFCMARPAYACMQVYIVEIVLGPWEGGGIYVPSHLYSAVSTISNNQPVIGVHNHCTR